MKRFTLNIFMILSLAIYSGCQIDDIVSHDDEYYYDNDRPAAPTNIFTVTGDNRVDISWDESVSRDVAGYDVYYNDTYEGTYTLLGHTETNNFIDYEARNGVTRYYAVAAYDYDDNVSDLSMDVVYDTPRPEGFNQAIYDYNNSPASAGYCFDTNSLTQYNDDSVTDFYFGNENGKYKIYVYCKDTHIQDMGATNDIYDISKAPESGWSPSGAAGTVYSMDAIKGHTYVIWTWNNHFAKIRVKNIISSRLIFDWAYQTSTTDEGYTELKTNGGKKTRK